MGSHSLLQEIFPTQGSNLGFLHRRQIPSKSLQQTVLPLHGLILPFPGGSDGSDGKESVDNAGEPGLIPGLGRSPGEGNDYPLQYFCLENSMDREAWQTTVHRVAKSQRIP